eukprot:3396986-Pleurochrysis_carterae.AAC.3
MASEGQERERAMEGQDMGPAGRAAGVQESVGRKSDARALFPPRELLAQRCGAKCFFVTRLSLCLELRRVPV